MSEACVIFVRDGLYLRHCPNKAHDSFYEKKLKRRCPNCRVRRGSLYGPAVRILKSTEEEVKEEVKQRERRFAVSFYGAKFHPIKTHEWKKTLN